MSNFISGYESDQAFDPKLGLPGASDPSLFLIPRLDEEDGDGWGESRRALIRHDNDDTYIVVNDGSHQYLSPRNPQPEGATWDEISRRHRPDRDFDIAESLVKARKKTLLKEDDEDIQTKMERLVQERLAEERSRVTRTLREDAARPEEDDREIEGYREIEIPQDLREEYAEKKIELPRRILVQELYEKRLSRLQTLKKIIFDPFKLGLACEHYNIEHAGDIVISSLEFDEDEPEIALGQLRDDGEVRETLTYGVQAADVELDPDPKFTDLEAVNEMNVAFYKALILSNRLPNAKSVDQEKDMLDGQLNDKRKHRLANTLGIAGVSGANAISYGTEALPPTWQVLLSSAVLATNVGHLVHMIRHKIPTVSELSDREIVDLMEQDVDKEAREMAAEYPVISFEIDI